MKLREQIQTALLIAIGLMMHYSVPGLIGGMKFDFMLAFIFIAILLNPTVKNTVLTAGVGGVLTALTTTFPGGQIPNMVDKIVTCFAIYVLVKLFSKLPEAISVGAISFIGTIISGSVFLSTALVLVGLPAPFTALFITVVLPAAIGNVFFTTLVHTALKRSIKHIRA